MNNIAQINIGNYFGGGNQGTSRFTFTNLSSISQLVSLFLNISFILAGLILLFYFILGGIGMIGSAGKNDPKSAEQAKQTITSALIGFAIVFAAYWIVQLMGTLLGIDKLI